MIMVAPAALLTNYENGSPDNASGCGNSTGYDDGRSGTYVATATSLAMATSLAVAMGAPATRLAARTLAKLGPMGSAVRTLINANVGTPVQTSVHFSMKP